MATFRNFWNVKCLSIEKINAKIIKLGAGGKPSTWFPPEGLVELENKRIHHAKNIASIK